MDHVKNNTEKGEAFLPSGEGIRTANLDEGLSEDCLPGLLPSILPLAVVLVLSAGFQVYVVKALFAGCILTVITGHKNLLPKLKTSLSQGITAAYGPILSVSATYAIGAVVKNIEGFTYFQNMLSAPASSDERKSYGTFSSLYHGICSSTDPGFRFPYVRSVHTGKDVVQAMPTA